MCVCVYIYICVCVCVFTTIGDCRNYESILGAGCFHYAVSDNTYHYMCTFTLCCCTKGVFASRYVNCVP